MNHPATGWTVEEIARVCHEANTAIQWAIGEPTSPAWSHAPGWLRDSVIAGVRKALNGATPEELHEAWCEHKRAEGWRYGPVKDETAKFHPCLVPYAELSEDQRRKDTVFHGIVNALAGKPQQPQPEIIVTRTSPAGMRLAASMTLVEHANTLLKAMTPAEAATLPSKAAQAMLLIQQAVTDPHGPVPLPVTGKPRQPAIGDTVHYVSYGTPGDEFGRACRAAVITETHGAGADGLDRASLVVLNPTGVFHDRQLPHLEASTTPTCDDLPRGGTWHWPAGA